MDKSPIKIVVTGPESTGKTELSRSLGGMLGTEFIPEYARGYVERLNRPYSYDDVEHIAQTQKDQLFDSIKKGMEIIILDTYLVITKIWFTEIYGRTPDWINDCLRESDIDLFLLCYYDIDWIKDSVRENPGPMRKYLFEKYKHEIITLGIPCEIIKGNGQERIQQAMDAIFRRYPELKKI